MSSANNTFLSIDQFPDFTVLCPEDASPAIQYLITDNQAQLATLLEQAPATWQTYEQIEELDNRLSKTFAPIAHLHNVCNNEDWRKAYQTCQQQLSAYSAEMAQHTKLYQFFTRLRDSAEAAEFNPAQHKLIGDTIHHFELSGVALPEAQKAQYRTHIQNLSELSTTFSNNVLDATQAFCHFITDIAELDGIPESTRALYRQLAEQRGQTDVERQAYAITLDFPAYYPAICHAKNRELRKTLYEAYAKRASEFTPDWNNAPIIEAILSTREDLAKLLDFVDYASLSLADKMAKNPKTVKAFLNDLLQQSRPQALIEFAELSQFANEQLGLAECEPWDIPYVSEQLRQARYAISDEQLRDYFPLSKVLSGLFDLSKQLFTVDFEPADLPVWHPDVTSFAVKDNGQVIAYFYLDLYARQGKNGGAWMNGATDRLHSSTQTQLPVAYLVCNFLPPAESQQAYLSHQEITTLFHEFGHGLHHMLTQVDYAALSGINGVEWDAVELPSQFMENFCFEQRVLQSMSARRQTGESLPDDWFERLIQAKNFQSAMQMIRQLEFSCFDLACHEHDTFLQHTDVLDLLSTLRAQIAVTPAPAYNRFPMSFSHIFAGGYAAGYYSYKWAEVLSADAFAAFEEQTQVIDASTGRCFRHEILARGASRTALDNFVAFRGREPNIEALLRHNGITG